MIMAKQLIFCLETSDKSDWVYIHDTVIHYFGNSPQVKLAPIYASSKTELLSEKTKKKIQERISQYRGDSVVIICFDTDSFESSQEDKRRNEAICAEICRNAWEGVWFCHTIEEVYLGSRIDNTQKTREADHFRRSQKINEVCEAQLCCQTPLGDFRSKQSNILEVLKRVYLP